MFPLMVPPLYGNDELSTFIESSSGVEAKPTLEDAGAGVKYDEASAAGDGASEGATDGEATDVAGVSMDAN